MEISDVVVRLGAAMLIGGAVGLNRDLHNKPTGVRTLGLVGLGSALVVIAIMDFPGASPNDLNALSRVMQGVVAGIGFLGIGVIVRKGGDPRIHGLTTAACIWVTACVGMVCGVGAWRLLLAAVPLIFLLLLLGGRLDRAIHERWGGSAGD